MTGLSYFRLSRRHGLLAGLGRVVKALLGLSNVCSTPDNAAYDMTVHAALRINKVRRMCLCALYVCVWGGRVFFWEARHTIRIVGRPLPKTTTHTTTTQVTTTYPGLFYFSFVGTCPRHRSPPAQGAQQGQECSDSSSPFTPPTTTTDEEQPQSQWLIALVKGLAYRLMAWHVSGVKFEVGFFFSSVYGKGCFVMTMYDAPGLPFLASMGLAPSPHHPSPTYIHKTGGRQRAAGRARGVCGAGARGQLGGAAVGGGRGERR